MADSGPRTILNSFAAHWTAKSGITKGTSVRFGPRLPVVSGRSQPKAALRKAGNIPSPNITFQCAEKVVVGTYDGTLVETSKLVEEASIAR
jgi:hypothetical protein